MAKGETSHSVLIVDDEPEYLGWVVDYLEGKGLRADLVRTLGTGLDALKTKEYRLILIDMNIPAGGAAASVAKRQGVLAEKYPGIAFAVHCRTQGYGAHQVIAYTVHDDDAADAELAKIHCRYVLKGRPQVLKRVVEASLRPQPPARRRKPRSAGK